MLCLTSSTKILYQVQEGLAAAFGNGLSTACIVNIGAQVTSVVCVEVIVLYISISAAGSDGKIFTSASVVLGANLESYVFHSENYSEG